MYVNALSAENKKGPKDILPGTKKIETFTIETNMTTL